MRWKAADLPRALLGGGSLGVGRVRSMGDRFHSVCGSMTGMTGNVGGCGGVSGGTNGSTGRKIIGGGAGGGVSGECGGTRFAT